MSHEIRQAEDVREGRMRWKDFEEWSVGKNLERDDLYLKLLFHS